MDKSFIWAWVFKNIIAILAWVTLAILFNKWWIALFALLFVSSIETKFKSYRVCDGCGKHSPYANSYNEALDKAKKQGGFTMWTVIEIIVQSVLRVWRINYG